MSILLLLLTAVGSDGPASASVASSRCGSYCLYVGLRALDLIDEPYSKFEKRLPPPGERGYSFLDLEQFAQRFGAHTMVLEADLDLLSRIEGRRACIAYMDQHFVVVSRFDGPDGKISIIDPPRTYNQTPDQFRKLFSQRTLILARGPIRLPADRVRQFGLLLTASASIALIGALTWNAKRRRMLAGSLFFLLAIVPTGCRPCT